MNQPYSEHTLDIICGIGLTFWACLLTLLIVLLCGALVKWVFEALGHKPREWYWSAVAFLAVYLCAETSIAVASLTTLASWLA